MGIFYILILDNFFFAVSGSKNCRNGQKNLDPEIVEMVQFLDAETVEILQFLDPEIVKIGKSISGFRNCRNSKISGSRNHRKGRQILYHFWFNILVHLVQTIMAMDKKDTVHHSENKKKDQKLSLSKRVVKA